MKCLEHRNTGAVATLTIETRLPATLRMDKTQQISDMFAATPRQVKFWFIMGLDCRIRQG